MVNKVSVIVPVYNVQDYIEECLLSIMNQSYKEIEIIAVNDGSKDDSLLVLEKMQARDSRIIILNKENGGLSDARNYGIKHSTGDYYLFVDSDDVIHENMVEELLESLMKENADIAVSDMEYFYEDSNERKYSSGGTFETTNCKKNPELIAINNSACNKLFKKELFQDVEFPFRKYYEDLALIPILLYKAKAVSKVNKAFYYYRQRKGSIAHSANRKIFDIYDALDGIYAYVKEHGNESEILDEIHHLYITHGLILTTLRIKDFDEKDVRKDYLLENIQRLEKSYPEYARDAYYKKAGIKQKIIFTLLRKRKMEAVLKIYDR